MSGMSLGFERSLGYDDDYKSSDSARDIYNLTWNGLDAQLGKLLNPASGAVSVATPNTTWAKRVCKETDSAIRRASRRAALSMDRKKPKE